MDKKIRMVGAYACVGPTCPRYMEGMICRDCKHIIDAVNSIGQLPDVFALPEDDTDLIAEWGYKGVEDEPEEDEWVDCPIIGFEAYQEGIQVARNLFYAFGYDFDAHEMGFLLSYGKHLTENRLMDMIGMDWDDAHNVIVCLRALHLI